MERIFGHIILLIVIIALLVGAVISNKFDEEDKKWED